MGVYKGASGHAYKISVFTYYNLTPNKVLIKVLTITDYTNSKESILAIYLLNYSASACIIRNFMC